MRQNSVDDVHLDQFLKISNYEDTVKQLDIYYGIGECGLFLLLQEFRLTSRQHTMSSSNLIKFQLKDNCLNIKVQYPDYFPYFLRITKWEAFETAYTVLLLFGVDFVLLPVSSNPTICVFPMKFFEKKIPLLLPVTMYRFDTALKS